MAAHRSGPVLFGVLGSLVGAVALLACSGKGAGTPVKGASDAGIADAAPPKLVVRPPPSGLPEMAKMPPPGVVGSKKATVKLDAALGACTGALNAQAKDPSAQLKKLGDACASSKMKPVGAAMRGSQGDKDAHQENKFHAEASHCYRVYVATDEAVKEAIVVMRDSAGDIVAESPAPAIPENGAACFTTADDVTLLVGVGSGKGSWSAQVWSN